VADLTVYLDPVCPWAWRGFLWVREVRAMRPLDVAWKVFSLKEINREDDPAARGEAFVEPAERALVLARREGGSEAFEALYLALGHARHDRRENLTNDSVIEAALEEAGLDRRLLQRALDDSSVHEEAAAEHRSAVSAYDAFGVPWLVLGEQRYGFFGPVIAEVPSGDAAIELWEHVTWLMARPYLYELKRPR
jgi:predicted DsbA family dithiol-disulfide isomerase